MYLPINMYPQNSISARATDQIERLWRQVVHANDIVDKRPPTPIVSGSSATTCVKSKYADLSVLLRRVRLEWCCGGFGGCLGAPQRPLGLIPHLTTSEVRKQSTADRNTFGNTLPRCSHFTKSLCTCIPKLLTPSLISAK